MDHPECLNFGPSGRLYAGGEAGQIYSIDLQKKTCDLLASTEGFIAGVVVDGDENVYACDIKKHRVFKIEQSGKITEFCKSVDGTALLTPNYAVFDDDGNMYFTDSGDYWKSNGRLVKVQPDGPVISILGSNLDFPNGLALSKDGKRLFMIESTSSKIVSFDITKDNSIGPIETYVSLPDMVPDGMAFDSEESLYVGCYKPYTIFKIDTKRNVSVLIDDKTGEVLNRPTNVAFPPDGLSHLYFSNLGGSHLGSLNVGKSGLKLKYPKLSKIPK